MIKLKIKYGNSQTDIRFPCTEKALQEALAEISAEQVRPLELYVTEVVFPEELDFLQDRFVNLDDVNYLAKRMDSFFGDEEYQFYEAMKLEGFDTLPDLINLSFNLNRYPLIRDIGDMGKIGREYLLTVNGCIPAHDEDDPKYAQLGRELIQSGNGIFTEHGMLFVDENTPFQRPYDGQTFPPYLYNPGVICVAKAEYDGKTEYLYFPCEEEAVDKAFAMAHKLELFELKDLINLTFCCQQATVITDFSDLAAVGRDHYMNLHGGSASVDELNKLDGEETARRLIENDSGKITPYGVVYDNGMKLEQVYDGRFFPCYYYEPNVITVAVTSKAEPEDTEHITWLYLPMVQEEIDRALLRGGITDPSEIRLSLEDSWLPHEVLDLLDMDHVDISELNALVQALDEFSDMSIRKYAAAAVMARPHTTEQAKHLAENLDLFDFAPSASTPEEYGKYMIQKSGRFDYDENLDAFYNYEKYGTERMNEEDGMFTDRGYIAYKGYYSMEEVMNGGQSSHMEMGGMM